MAESILSHPVSLLRKNRGWQSHSVTLLFNFFDSSSFPWWLSLSQNQLPGFSKDGSQMRKRISSKPSCIIHPRPHRFARLVYSCHDFWILLGTQPGHTKVSHTQPGPGPETVHVSTRAHWCSSLRQTTWKAPQEKLLGPFLCMWWYTSQIVTRGKEKGGHAEWALTKGQAKQTLPVLASHPRAKRDARFIDGGSDK